MDRSRRSRVPGDRQSTRVPTWEVFIRSEPTDPLHHVGSVTGSTAEEAHEQATALFGWDDVDLWLCPAEAVERYTTRQVLGHSDQSQETDEPQETTVGVDQA